jgi:glutathione S-transferase
VRAGRSSRGRHQGRAVPAWRILAAVQPDVVLHQFARSHFNEKARWALDWKCIPHRRRTHFPGPHAPALLRLSGQRATPVLVVDGEAIPGSAAILAALDARFPERPLLPADPTLAARALALQGHFDAEVGPAVRTAVFSVLIREPDQLCRTFSQGKPAWSSALYRAAFPLTRPVIARANGVVDPANVERAFARSEAALDLVARQVGPSGQLVGEAFSLADLACAALLAPLLSLDHPDMRTPEPRPAALAAFHARFATHPGAAWVREQYQKHRPPPCTIPG